MRASSPVVRFFCETRGLRILGRRLFPVFQARLSNGDTAYLRSQYDWDVSTFEEVFYKNIYEKVYAIKPGDVVLDVGAHIGSFTVKAAREVGPIGRVLSFEPSSENFKLLSQNVGANGYTNTKLFRVAVGGAPGTAKLRLHKRHGANSLYEAPDMELVGTEEVAVRTLDSVVIELDLDEVDFIKIDVEGSELEVLKGATNTLATYHPSIAMETHDFGPSVQEIGDLLLKLGYAVKRVPYRTRLGLLYASKAPNLAGEGSPDRLGEKA